MFLPMELLRKLRIPLQEKIGLAAIFSIAIFSMAFAITSAVVYFSQLATSKQFAFNKNTNIDPNWLVFWSVLECSTATLISSLPTFRLLLRSKPKNKNSPPQAHSKESYDADGLAKLKNGKRSNGGQTQGRGNQPGTSPDSSQYTLRKWLLRFTPSSYRSHESSGTHVSFVHYIWPGRGCLGNRGSLHGPLDSLSIPGGTLMTREQPEPGEKDWGIEEAQFRRDVDSKKGSTVKVAEAYSQV
ncbi:MAG: hypothetical protein M1814_006761 [Vezdaea aestivalis]|nr:MAG: hypothetical protein M1814_006761 [Vezdaea aestivalis]